MKDLINYYKKLLDYNLEQSEEPLKNHTYKEEQLLLTYIKNGEVEHVASIVETAFPAYPHSMDMNEKKYEEYIAACSVAIAVRAAIESGLTSQEGFYISDIVLEEIAHAKDLADVIEIRNSALIALTMQVRERTQNNDEILYINSAKQYIVDHIFQKFKVTDVAEAVGISSIYLEKLFKEKESTTISSYISSEKIERARNMLRFSDRSIIEISDYLGFSSQSHFGVVFKRVTGITPNQYRQNFHAK